MYLSSTERMLVSLEKDIHEEEAKVLVLSVDCLYLCCTGIPHFSKVHCTPFCFYERLTLIPIFTNLDTSEKDFHVSEKK